MTEKRRIKASEVPVIRAALVIEQNNRCLMCHGLFYTKMPLDPVLDHDHKTGALRGVLHRGCNSLLGKFENYAPQAWVKRENLGMVAAGMADYLLSYSPRPRKKHHTFRTAEEKAVTAKARVKRRRATKKAKP